MRPDEPDDDPPPSGPPLPPEDRLWRHPSELGAYGAGGPSRADESPASGPTQSSFTAEPVGRAGGRTRGTLAATAVASCLIGAFVALVGVALLRTDDEPSGNASADVASSAPTSVSLRVGAAGREAGEIAPSVARIVVRIGDRWVSGAGTLVDTKGSVVTAASLVAGASQVQVTFQDERSRKGTVVGTDADTGLAVVHVDADGVEPVPLARSRPSVGEQVTLVSGPDDDGTTARATVGRVRTVDTEVHATTGTLDDLVAIDREVLPDQDGGAVANGSGHLAGVGLSGDPTDGHGEVVPADVVEDVTQQLVEGGTGSRAWLGIEAVDLDDMRAEALGVEGGARLTKVESGSPAARAGLATDDVVVAIDGRSIRSTTAIVDTLGTLAPQQRVTMHVLRDGTALDLSVTLATKPSD